MCAECLRRHADEDRKWATYKNGEYDAYADESKEESEARFQRTRDLGNEISDMTANTIAGLQAKAKVMIAEKSHENEKWALIFLEEVAEFVPAAAV
jgi:hypothetical protein